MKEKKCSVCEQTKPIECFYKKSGRKNQWQSYCKPCHLERSTKARDKNPNTKQRTAKNWKEWSQKEENREKRRIYQREYYKKRCKEDPFYRLKHRMGSWIMIYVKKNEGKKTGSVWEHLPYTPQELREHIEKQFDENMSWENHGNGKGCWNLDHIYPHSLLPYDSMEHPNFKKAWALDNLKPIPWEENLKKSNKILQEDKKCP
jgi:hypothetical protein